MDIKYVTNQLHNYNASSKPKLYEKDNSFPYHLLNPFEFEDLTYFVIKQVIENKKEWEGFKSVELLGGVKDSGQDCVLKINKINHGLIQCKQSKPNIKLSKIVLAKEIIKFLLYSINKPSLIPDINKYKYYIFSSSGLHSKTSELIDDFNNNIFKEKSLEKWVNDIINQHSSIRNLKSYNSIKKKLNVKLKNIIIKELKVKDFNLLLDQEFNKNIITKFFSIKSVIDKNRFEEILKENFNSDVKPSEAISLIEKVSSSYSKIQNYFGKNKQTHINRKETDKLFDWVLSDLPNKKKNIAVLEANAGLGKTVVLKDLYEKLRTVGIATLAIKADKYFASDLVKLEQKIFQKKNIHIVNIITALKQSNQKIVILIDQLDALSQTLSTRRDYLLTYNRLIKELSTIRGVRIIVSIRSFDLKYDSELSIYKSNEYSQFKLGKLNSNEVKIVLTQYKIKNIPDKLIELLQIPNHLDIFCKLPNKEKYKLELLNSLKDLYDILWDEIIIEKNISNSKTTKSLLFDIVNKMSQSQKTVVVNLYKDEYNAELQYLKSNGLLIEDNKYLQFFHQTFYDYVFSKYFVESRYSLIEFIKKNEQSLYVRQIIKMVLEYLREYNEEDYISIITQIIKSKRYRFHVKMIIITSLGIISNPTDKEKLFAEKYLLYNPQYYNTFINSIVSKGWFEFLISIDIIQNFLFFKKDLKHKTFEILSKWYINKTNSFKTYEKEKETKRLLITRLIVNNITTNSDLIIKTLGNFPNISNKSEYIINILYHFENWENKKLLYLFEKHFNYDEKISEHNNNFWYYKSLKDISSHHPYFVFEKLKPIIFNIFNDASYSVYFEHSLKDLIKKIEENFPKETFDFLLELMIDIVEKFKIQNRNNSLYKSQFFSDMGFKTLHSKDADDFIFELLRNHIELNMSEDDLINFLYKYKKNRLIPLLKLCTVAIIKNPLKFYSQAFEIINFIALNNGFIGNDDRFQYQLRKMIGKCFEFFSNSQKEKIVDIIFKVKRFDEGKIDKYNGKIYRDLNIGKKQYLFINEIPKKEINKIAILKKRYQELKRKFGKISNRPMDESRTSVTWVGPPLPTNAYRFMDFKQWLKSMLIFNDNYIRDRFSHSEKGGTSEHIRAFKEEVRNRSKYFYPFIVKLIKENKVSKSYMVSGLEGLIKGKFEPEKIYKLYKEILNLDLDYSNTLYLVWATEYLIQNKLIDDEIIDFLVNLIEKYPIIRISRQTIDPVSESLNTIKGTAIRFLMLSQFKDKKETIFSVIEKTQKDKSPSVKVAILSNIAHLNKFDIDRSFSIFDKITKECNAEILEHSIWSSNYYLKKYFKRMIPYINRLLENDKLLRNGVILIAKSWIVDINGSEKMMKKLPENNPIVIDAILEVAEGNLFLNGKVNKKCLNLLNKYINYENNEIASRYSFIILRKFNEDNFLTFYPFLKKYAKSTHPNFDPFYYFQYLIKCSSKYPKQCLFLIKSSFPYKTPNVQNRGYYDKEPIQIILSIYSSLNNDFNKNKKPIRESLNVFDKMLQIDHLRYNLNSALDSLN